MRRKWGVHGSLGKPSDELPPFAPVIFIFLFFFLRSGGGGMANTTSIRYFHSGDT